MAIEKITYEGIPAGAVFDASKASLGALGLTTITSDPRTLAITAQTSETPSAYSRKVSLEMREVGKATELTITSADSSMFRNLGDFGALVSKIMAQNDLEIGKMLDEGRIARPKPVVYEMGQFPPQAATAVSAPKPPEKETSKAGNWAFRILACAAALWLIKTDAGNEVLASIFGDVTAEMDIAEYDCDKLARLAKGEELMNLFGGKFKVISVGPLKQVERTASKFACEGDLILSSGGTQTATISVEKMPDKQVLFRIE